MKNTIKPIDVVTGFFQAINKGDFFKSEPVYDYES